MDNNAHYAYVVIVNNGNGHGECLFCDWAGPDRENDHHAIHRDCIEHEGPIIMPAENYASRKIEDEDG